MQWEFEMTSVLTDTARRRRQALRNAGLRAVQIWAPDSRQAGFAEECRRQVRLVAEAGEEDRSVSEFLEAALQDLSDSGEWK
jgi:hypothetical protein